MGHKCVYTTMHCTFKNDWFPIYYSQNSIGNNLGS